MIESAVLLVACPDRPGIVSRVASHIFDQGGNILRAEQSESMADSQFYQRIHFDLPGGTLDLEKFRQGFAPIGSDLGAVWSLRPVDRDQRVAVMVSQHLDGSNLPQAVDCERDESANCSL